MKKYFVLLVCFFVNSSIRAMEFPLRRGRDSVPEAERLFNDKPQNINFIFGGQGGGASVPMSFEWSARRGFYEGVEQGTANVIASLIVQTAALGIRSGVEWWQQPNEEELKVLILQMQIKNLFKAMEKNVEKKQKAIAAYSAIIAMLGQNVEIAQKIYTTQVHQVDEKSPEDKYLEIYNTLSDMTIESLREQRMVMGAEASNILNSFKGEE